MKTRTETHRVVDVDVPGGSTLRVALAEDGSAGDVPAEGPRRSTSNPQGTGPSGTGLYGPEPSERWPL